MYFVHSMLVSKTIEVERSKVYMEMINIAKGPWLPVPTHELIQGQ